MDQSSQIYEGKLYEFVLLSFISVCAMLVFWAGHTARRELTAETQERFSVFIKVFMDLFVILVILFTLSFILKGEINLGDGQTSLEELTMYIMIAQAVAFRIFFSRAKSFHEHLKKYESNSKYERERSFVDERGKSFADERSKSFAGGSVSTAQL